MSDNVVRIVAHPHPFSPRLRTDRDTLPGRNLDELVREAVPHSVGRIVVQVDGTTIAREAWPDTVPAGGSLVTIRVWPAGADETVRTGTKAGGWAIAGAFISIALAPLTGGLSLLVTPYLIGVGAVALGTAFVVQSYKALDGLISGTNQETTPDIRGGRNRAAPWGKVPVVLGKHLVVPPYAARPYTELGAEVPMPIVGGTYGTHDVFLRQLFVVGYGPLRLSQFKIGESLLASNSAGVRNGAVAIDGVFANVELEVYQDGTAPTLYPGVVLEDQPNVELKYGVETWRTTAPNVTRVSVDVSLPRGLYRYASDGTISGRYVEVEVRRRAVGSGTAWASCTLVGTALVSGNNTKPRWANVAADVPAGQYEIGVKRITADDPADYRGMSQTYWGALRSMRPTVEPIDAALRSKLVVVALKIKASNQLQGIVDQLSCIAEAEVPAYDGTGTGAAEWPLGFSRNPAAQYLALLRGNSNPRPVPDSAIDWARFEEWHALCATKGWTCDAVLSSGARLRDIGQQVATTGRASITLRDGLYSVVVDEPKVAAVQQFTPKNVRSFSWSKAFFEKPHALRVNFISADDGYAPNERMVLADGYKYDTDGDGVLRDWLGVDRTSDGSYVLASKFRQASMFGVTDAELVVKHSRYLLAGLSLRPEVFTFETDAEAIVCEPGDLVRVSHDAIAVGIASGRVKAVDVDGSGNAISCEVDESVVFEVGKSYGVRFRLADGTSVYSTLSNAGGYEGSTLAFASSIPAANVPAIGDLFTFGEAGIETMACIVAGIEMLDDLACRLTVVDEAPGVHTADTGAIPAFVSRVSRQPVMSEPSTVQTPITVAVDHVVEYEIAAAEVATAVAAPARAPGYLGAYLFSVLPATASEDDTVLAYSATLEERGIYAMIDGTWTKLAAPTTDVLSLAWPDISRATLSEAAGGFPGGPYGVAADYFGSGVDVFSALAAQVAFIDKLFANQIDVLSGGTIRYYNGAGVQRRAVEIGQEAIRWLDCPDTDPATAETLQAIIARLGAGPSMLMDGEFNANIEEPWSTGSVINAAYSFDPTYIQLANGELRSAYRRNSDGYIVERTLQRYARVGAGIIETSLSNASSYSVFSTGLVIEHGKTSITMAAGANTYAIVGPVTFANNNAAFWGFTLRPGSHWNFVFNGDSITAAAYARNIVITNNGAAQPCEVSWFAIGPKAV